jgi:hypothetical protein
MSVCGGFPTRKLENHYNELIYELLDLMQTTIAKYIAKCTASSYGRAG